MTENLGDIEHTNPHTGESFGRTQVYDRGKKVAADGGAAAVVDADDASATPDGGTESPETLGDVDHTPPGDAMGTQGVYDGSYEHDDE